MAENAAHPTPTAKRRCTPQMKVPLAYTSLFISSHSYALALQVLVTGGTGLVGRALAELVTSEPQSNEEWIFLSSKDGDLWYRIMQC